MISKGFKNVLQISGALGAIISIFSTYKSTSKNTVLNECKTIYPEKKLNNGINNTHHIEIMETPKIVPVIKSVCSENNELW